ncbi:alkaline phosphatase PafA [Abyssalbus ytuae]|uniref:Alkaline phosphatase family protein n=1 Tax=Abyssalbus ytuae TaxID=2926907 RepID=A0A9E7D0X5_9FLAO|nr:alkaline phosphatase PafA [Abyssalbus ytuae]UOB18820.1 alkaline phosphatase family protein [Abyssalbus ytuae]
MKRYILILFLFFSVYGLKSQSKSPEPYVKPKLVVGIVVDQMRYDYLTRFWGKYGNGGFKRLVNEGFNCKNNHFNYVPTYTGPGHASIYTGTTPAVHGIIANNWYDKTIDKKVYCAGDENVLQIGTESKAERMSPHRMLTTTMTDQLRLATQMQSKVIGISIKDRGAILPAGHTANAAFWFHGKDEGVWVSSSHYMNELPKWVVKFNKSDAAEKYKKTWNTLYDIKSYKESGTDKNDFEGFFKGETLNVFPHELDKIWDKNSGFDIIKTSPFGNSITADFAIAALDGEQLGKDNITDFLAVSFSSTDYVGHAFGVNSVEVEDTYLRLDQDLERLLLALDNKVGKGEYTVFLTADHGAVQVPSYLQSLKIPAGYFDTSEFLVKLDSFLLKKFNTSHLIKNISNNQIFLDHDVLESNHLNVEELEYAIAGEIIKYKGIAEVYTAREMKFNSYSGGIKKLLQNGFNHKRSGDVLVVFQPAVIDYNKTGSTHGSGFNYDTHVPLLFFGKGIKKGATYEQTEITDIAPTICSLLGIAFPNGTTGKTISAVIK